jgi:hypothetical protein
LPSPHTLSQIRIRRHTRHLILPEVEETFGDVSTIGILVVWIFGVGRFGHGSQYVMGLSGGHPANGPGGHLETDVWRRGIPRDERFQLFP